MSLFQRTHMPSLDGAAGWLNTGPLGPAELHGRVVVVDFWTYTCINWLRTLPYVRTWAEKYRDDGLTVIGVHTPEFDFEHDVDNVRRAVEQMDIAYPVALDPEYRVWRAFDNSYWPALYFVDRDGIIRDHHFGEGRYEESERTIQRLLGVDGDLVSLEGQGIEAPADWDGLASPETYIGHDRGERQAPPGEPLGLNEWSLAGDWTVGRQAAELNDTGGSIAYRFTSRDLHSSPPASRDRRACAVPGPDRRQGSGRLARTRRSMPRATASPSSPGSTSSCERRERPIQAPSRSHSSIPESAPTSSHSARKGAASWQSSSCRASCARISSNTI